MPDASIYVGADTEEMRQELANAATAAEQGGRRIGKSFEHGANAHESLFKSQRRVENSAIALTSRIMSSGSAMDVAAASAEALERSLHLPVGVAIGIGAAAMAYEKLHESLQKVKEANEGMEKNLVGSAEDVAAEGTGAASSKIEENNKSIETARKSRTFGAAVAAFYSGSTALDQSLKLEEEILNRNFEISEKIVVRVKEEMRVRMIGVTQSEREGAILKAELETRDKIAKLNLNTNLQTNARQALVEQAKEELQITEQEINAKSAAKEREIALEERILALKKAGRGGEVETAMARYDKASHDLAAAKTDEEKRNAQLKLNAADYEVHQAAKISEEKKAQRKIDTDIARMVGSPDKKQAAKLEAEGDELGRRHALAARGGDEEKQIELEIAKNEESKRAVAQSEFQKEMAKFRSEKRAGKGRGDDAEIAAAKSEMFALNGELTNATAQYGAQSAEVAEINAKIAEQKRHIEDIVFAKAQELTAAKAKTAEMYLQEHGDVNGAKQSQIRAQFEAQITQALRNKNYQLADQLRKQQQIAQNDQKIEEYLKTPQQKAQERAEKRVRDRAARTIESREKIHAHDVDANRDTFSDRFGPAKKTPLGEAARKAGFGGHTALDKRPGQDGDAAGTKPAPSPGATGAANDTMTIKQMTVETMSVATLNVTNFELKSTE